MATPPTPGTPAPPTAAPAARRRRWVIPVVAVVVAAVIAVAALAAAGDLHLGASTSNSTGDATFSQALGAAESGAASASGGPWTAVVGSALVTPLEVTEPATNLTDLSEITNCTVDWIGGAPSVVVVPATSSGASVGTSAYWAFVLKNSTDALLVETVSQGTADALVTLTGGDCATIASFVVAFPGGMPDSPTILAAVNAAGGAAFLSDHANASELWGVLGGYTALGITTAPEWIVEYTACSATASPTENGAIFNATVNGLSAVVTNHTSGTADCALSVSAGTGLAAPAPFFATLLRKAI